MTYLKRLYTVSVTTYQLAVLLAFNTAEQHSYRWANVLYREQFNEPRLPSCEQLYAHPPCIGHCTLIVMITSESEVLSTKP